jgi:AraC-like DNA-binding protein
MMERRNFIQTTGLLTALGMLPTAALQAFREKNLRSKRDWQSIAFDCNYYDYQHLVRDYQAFTGLKPTDFHLLESRAPERSFGLAEHYYETQV